jgi:hypothetical protein
MRLMVVSHDSIVGSLRAAAVTLSKPTLTSAMSSPADTFLPSMTNWQMKDSRQEPGPILAKDLRQKQRKSLQMS